MKASQAMHEELESAWEAMQQSGRLHALDREKYRALLQRFMNLREKEIREEGGPNG